jgi:hypothetical protein
MRWTLSAKCADILTEFAMLNTAMINALDPTAALKRVAKLAELNSVPEQQIKSQPR